MNNRDDSRERLCLANARAWLTAYRAGMDLEAIHQRNLQRLLAFAQGEATWPDETTWPEERYDPCPVCTVDIPLPRLGTTQTVVCPTCAEPWEARRDAYGAFARFVPPPAAGEAHG